MQPSTLFHPPLESIPLTSLLSLAMGTGLNSGLMFGLVSLHLLFASFIFSVLLQINRPPFQIFFLILLLVSLGTYLFTRESHVSEHDYISSLHDALEHFHLAPSQPDRYRWTLDPSGIFSIKSFVSFLCSPSPSPLPSFPDKLVWIGLSPPWVKAFILIASQCRMNIMDRLQMRHPYMALSPHIYMPCMLDGESSAQFLL